jgi:ParB family chromosome partitioning protein
MATALKKGLGKGLGALITSSAEDIDNLSGIVMLDIIQIEPNKRQPRKRFNDESLNSLAESIKQFGVIQPIIVKKDGEGFSIVAGERRWRAARKAELRQIPAIVRDCNDLETIELALIENLHREDLNPIEEAECYKRLVVEFFHTQDELAEKVGKSKSSISYALSLLELDTAIQDYVAEGAITPGHARAISKLSTERQLDLAQAIIEEGLSVRETERLAVKDPAPGKSDPREPKAADINYSMIEKSLREMYGTKVRINAGKNKGKIELEYHNEEDLDRLLRLLNVVRD